MIKYKNLKLISELRNLDEESFIMRLQNGYVLFVRYEYVENGKIYELDYDLWRTKINDSSRYLLTIEAGDPNYYWEPADQRDERHEFQSPQEAINFLKEKEYFNISDWGYRKGIFVKQTKNQKHDEDETN